MATVVPGQPGDGVGPEMVAEAFSFPTSLAFDAQGTPYVAESGLGFAGAEKGGRVWRLDRHGRRTLVLDDFREPVNGIVFAEGALYVSEGGNPGRITRLDGRGRRHAILDGLPGGGNYHTNMAVQGSDGRLYFSQGAMTNLGVVGLDAYQLGWLGRLPQGHDLPGLDVELVGANFDSPNPLQPDSGPARTGAFHPFGVAGSPGERLAATLPCTAAVMRCDLDGGGLELVAWGLRNAYGLGVLPDGRLLAIDQGADDRGSRPVGDAPDLLFEVSEGSWYGWPDFIGGEPVTSDRFKPSRGPEPGFLLGNHADLPSPARPLFQFPAHSAAVKFDVAPDGWLAVALFGDERPMTAPLGPRVGRSVAALDLVSGELRQLVGAPLERPIDVRFDPVDGDLWMLDFGRFEMSESGLEAAKGTGRLWRVGGRHSSLA